MDVKEKVIRALSDIPPRGDSAAIALEQQGIDVFTPDKDDIALGEMAIEVEQTELWIVVLTDDERRKLRNA